MYQTYTCQIHLNENYQFARRENKTRTSVKLLRAKDFLKTQKLFSSNAKRSAAKGTKTNNRV